MARLPVAIAAGAPALAESLRSASQYAAAEKSAATRRAYASDWKHYTWWCAQNAVAELPSTPATVAAYLAHLADAGRSASTIARRLAAIGYAHKLKGLEPPTAAEAVRAVNRGIRRRIGTAPTQKAPATALTVGAMLGGPRRNAEFSRAELRDRAILLIGFAAALRRSELVDLKVNDVELGPDGALITIRRSKTDQEGQGAVIAVPRGEILRPVEALEAWLDVLYREANATVPSLAGMQGIRGVIAPETFDAGAGPTPNTSPRAGGIAKGPIFRPIGKGGRIGAGALSDRSVADIVKRYAAAAGLDPKLFAGHSLRAGFVTSALAHGADVLKIMDVTRHQRIETLRLYDRRAKAFRDHAGKDFL